MLKIFAWLFKTLEQGNFIWNIFKCFNYNTTTYNGIVNNTFKKNWLALLF